MNTMKLNSEEIKASFNNAFDISPEERIEIRANVISLNYLSEIEKAMTSAMSRKELADKIGTSPSYLTQLFRGDRRLNFKTIAKIEHVLNIKFAIKAESENIELNISKNIFEPQKQIDFIANYKTIKSSYKEVRNTKDTISLVA